MKIKVTRTTTEVCYVDVKDLYEAQYLADSGELEYPLEYEEELDYEEVTNEEVAKVVKDALGIEEVRS